MVVEDPGGEPRCPDRRGVRDGRGRCGRARPYGWMARVQACRSGRSGGWVGSAGADADGWDARLLFGDAGRGAAVVAGRPGRDRLPRRWGLHHRVALGARHRQCADPLRDRRNQRTPRSRDRFVPIAGLPRSAPRSCPADRPCVSAGRRRDARRPGSSPATISPGGTAPPNRRSRLPPPQAIPAGRRRRWSPAPTPTHGWNRSATCYTSPPTPIPQNPSVPRHKRGW